MNRHCFVILSVLSAATLSAFPASSPATESSHPISGLDFLAGVWRGPMWGGEFEAHYSTTAGGRVIGYSRLFRGERVAFYEFEVFQVDDGRAPKPPAPGGEAGSQPAERPQASESDEKPPRVVLLPYPGGRPAVPLYLTSVDPAARRAVFENPGKDYPTRIVYHRVESDRLVITLDDPHGGGEKVEVFDLRISN